MAGLIIFILMYCTAALIHVSYRYSVAIDAEDRSDAFWILCVWFFFISIPASLVYMYCVFWMCLLGIGDWHPYKDRVK